MAVLLFSLKTNHDDRPICLTTMMCALSLPPSLYNYITADTLVVTAGFRYNSSVHFAAAVFAHTHKLYHVLFSPSYLQ